MKIFVHYGTVEKVGMGSVNISFISWSKFFFQVKSENIQFLHMKNMWDFIY